MRGSRDIGFDPPFGPFYPILTHFVHFRALPVIWKVYIIWNTNRKLGPAVILRGQTSFYDPYFTRTYLFQQDSYKKTCKIKNGLIHQFPMPKKFWKNSWNVVSWWVMTHFMWGIIGELCGFLGHPTTYTAKKLILNGIIACQKNVEFIFAVPFACTLVICV